MRDGEMVWIGKGGRHGFGVERRGRLGCNFFFCARETRGISRCGVRREIERHVTIPYRLS